MVREKRKYRKKINIIMIIIKTQSCLTAVCVYANRATDDLNSKFYVRFFFVFLKSNAISKHANCRVRFLYACTFSGFHADT